jgi:ribosomal protein L11 methyltransferase
MEPLIGALMACGVLNIQVIDDDEMAAFLHANPQDWDYIDETLDVRRAPEAIFYVSGDPAGREALDAVKGYITPLFGADAITHTVVDDETWLHEWKKYYKPFRVGCSVVVCPAGEAYAAAPGDVVFTIEPGGVFGTGLHATTQLCIQAIERYVRPGMDILDVGCGSGILSVVALLLGAGSAYACDIDPAALRCASLNAEHNGVGARISVRIGDIFQDAGIMREITGRKYDLVVANIVADAVIRLSDMAQSWLKPEGLLVISGIITERAEDVRAALTRNNWRTVGEWSADNWHCLAAGAGNV